MRCASSTSATGSSNVATTRWIRRSTSASRNASSATRRDVSSDARRLFDEDQTAAQTPPVTMDVRIPTSSRAPRRTARPHRRDPRRRRPHLRRARRRRQPRRAPLAGRGRRAPRPGGLVGSDRPRRARASATAPPRSGAALAPINPGLHRGRGHRRARDLRPRLVVVHPSYEDVGACDRGAARPPRPRHRRRVASRRVERATRPVSATSEDPCGDLPHQRVDRCVEGRACSRTARPGCAPSQRDAEDGAPGVSGEVVMFGLFHMAGWYVLEHALGGEPCPCTSCTAPTPDELLGAVERWRASTLYAIPAVWERILDDDAAYDTSSLGEVLTGTSLVDARAHRRVEGALSRDRGRRSRTAPPRSAAARCCRRRPVRPAAERRVAATEVEADRRRRRAVLRGPTMFSGYLDRPDATADAIDDDGWYHTGDLATRRRRRLPHDHRAPLRVDPLGRRMGRAGRSGEPPSSRTRPSPRSAWSGFPTTVGARWCARRSSCGPAPRCRPSTSFASHVASTLVGGQAAARRRAGRRAAPHRRHRSDPATAPARRPSSPRVRVS